MRAIPKKIKDRAIKLYKGKYKGFGPTLAQEKLFEIEKIKISDETLRNWLIEKANGRRFAKEGNTRLSERERLVLAKFPKWMAFIKRNRSGCGKAIYPNKPGLQ